MLGWLLQLHLNIPFLPSEASGTDSIQSSQDDTACVILPAV